MQTGRAAWTYRGDELVMTTEPLDIGGLVRAGEGKQWVGAPEGTTMGHLHIHVGDLASAEAFYHRALGFDKTVWSYKAGSEGDGRLVDQRGFVPASAARLDQGLLRGVRLLVQRRPRARMRYPCRFIARAALSLFLRAVAL
jgi:hypothetical protein